MAEIIGKLPRVRSLVFDSDLSLYPPSYKVLLAQYPITTLSMWDLSIFPSWLSLFNFIWAFPELQTLRLGSHLAGLPGKADKVDELTPQKAARISAIAKRGRCQRLRALELEDIWCTCPTFPPKGVFGCTLEKLTVKVGERASSAVFSAFPSATILFGDLATLPMLQTLEIHLTRYASAPASEIWRHRRMASEVMFIVQQMYLHNCPLRDLRVRFGAPPTPEDLPIPFNAKLLLGRYFEHVFVGPVQNAPSWRLLRNFEIVVPSNDLPRSCLATDWLEEHLRASVHWPYDERTKPSLSFYQAYPHLDPDKVLPPAWYCIRHRAAVSPTVCSRECFKKGPLPQDIAEGPFPLLPA